MTTTSPSKLPALWFCLLMDAIGYVSYAFPGIGESIDLVWGPVSGIIFYLAFGTWKGIALGVFNAAEELLPGLDFIPTFTLYYFWVSHQRKKLSESKG